MVASDLREENDLLKGTGPYVSIDVMNKEMLHVQVIRQSITADLPAGSHSFRHRRKESQPGLEPQYARGC